MILMHHNRCLRKVGIVGIFYEYEIFWYFIFANTLKSNDFMCNYNSEKSDFLRINFIIIRQLT